MVGTTYTNFVFLLNIVASPAFTCSISTGGYCQSTSPCSAYSSLWEFSFQVAFEQNKTTYLIVPLSTFASDVIGTNGQQMCTLFVTSLDPKVKGNNQNIFGSQFFTNYYGVFVNNYNNTPVTQTAQLYTAQNALSTTLLSSSPRSTGSDVFVIPPSPTVKSHKGLIIGLGCAAGVLLIGIIVVVVLLVQAKKKEQQRAVLYGTEGQTRDSQRLI